MMQRSSGLMPAPSLPKRRAAMWTPWIPLPTISHDTCIELLLLWLWLLLVVSGFCHLECPVIAIFLRVFGRNQLCFAAKWDHTGTGIWIFNLEVKISKNLTHSNAWDTHSHAFSRISRIQMREECVSFPAKCVRMRENASNASNARILVLLKLPLFRFYKIQVDLWAISRKT